MVWGCMGWSGVGRIDATQYCDILSRSLLLTIENLSEDPDLPIKDHLLFQPDNNPKHTSLLAKRWFESEQVRVMDCPPQSPDLNPIEHPWGHLERSLESTHSHPKVFWICGRVEVEWETITAETCKGLIKSMPSRVEAMIKARASRQTRY